jgi:cytochrome c-type biogenesis protein CcmH
MIMRTIAVLLALTLIMPAAVQAVEPDEVLDDPKLEQRAREISRGLRCVVCQNESIDESNADLAKDLRILVRDRLEAGDSNDEVVDYVVARYGEFVLMEPRFAPHTYLLWLAPLALLLFGLLLAWKLFRGPAAQVEASAPKPLSEAERQRLKRMLSEGSDDGAGTR